MMQIKLMISATVNSHYKKYYQKIQNYAELVKYFTKINKATKIRCLKAIMS